MFLFSSALCALTSACFIASGSPVGCGATAIRLVDILSAGIEPENVATGSCCTFAAIAASSFGITPETDTSLLTSSEADADSFGNVPEKDADSTGSTFSDTAADSFGSAPENDTNAVAVDTVIAALAVSFGSVPLNDATYAAFMLADAVSFGMMPENVSETAPLAGVS